MSVFHRVFFVHFDEKIIEIFVSAFIGDRQSWPENNVNTHHEFTLDEAVQAASKCQLYNLTKKKKQHKF